MRPITVFLIVLGYVVLFAAVFVLSFHASIVRTVSVALKPLKVKWTHRSGIICRDLPYKNDYGNAYDLYIPAGLDPNRDQVLILYIHGGGFTGGTKDGGKLWCKFLADKGYITAAVDYTVHNKKHSSDLHRMNQEISDCVEAICKRCQELGYRVTGMATTGESAGGCLAMLYAYSQPTDAPIPIKFVFQQTGPAHFDPADWGNSDAEAAASFLSMMTGKRITSEMVVNGEAEQEMIAISPACLVNSGTVPTLCAYGPKDKIVPPVLKFKLFEAFEQYGVPYDYIEFPNSNHGMYSDPDKQREYITKVLEYCKTYLKNQV